jgi:dihydroorotate dehydrogenase (fumarate)
VEQRHVEILTTVKAVVKVPVAVKLSPYFSSTGEMALRLDRAGADGLVLFNRFLQPDIDPETLTVTVQFGLSSPAEGRLPRAWIALLARRVRASLAATTGVEDATDVVKYLLAGADVVMTASSLLRHGPGHADTLLDGLASWMVQKQFASVSEVRGLLAVPRGDEAARERADYVTAMRAANQGHGPW